MDLICTFCEYLTWTLPTLMFTELPDDGVQRQKHVDID